jgi:hypothetical protein
MATAKVIVEIQQIRDGKVIAGEKTENLVCAAGMAVMAALVIGQSSKFFNYVSVGTGTATLEATITALAAEVQRTEAYTLGLSTTTYNNDTANVTGGFNFTSTYSVTEAGLFDAASGGDMLGYVTIGPYNVVPGDQFTIQWQEVIS